MNAGSRKPTASERLTQLEHCLSAIDEPEKELFVKTGRSRTATFSVGSNQALRINSQVANETGHAARLGDDKRALSWFGTGWPEPDALRSIPSSYFTAGRLSLPNPDQAQGSTVEPLASAAPDLGRPLLNESEVRRLISSLEQLLHDDLLQRFVLTGHLADGAAQSWLLNGHGVTAVQRARTTSLRIDLTVSGRNFSTYLGGTGATLRPRQIAQRLLDRVAIENKSNPFSGNVTALLAPQVVATLLSAVAGQFLQPPSRSVASTPLSTAVSLEDDPIAANGASWSPTDGEGVATKSTQLIERGEHCTWLRPWNEPCDTDSPTTGCRYRNGWRDQPAHRCSNLVLASSSTPPSELLASLDSGVYLVASDQVAKHTADGTLLVRAVGFEVNQGSTVQPITTTLRMPAVSVLAKIATVGRDQETLVPSGVAASVSAPSALFEAVELLA